MDLDNYRIGNEPRLAEQFITAIIILSGFFET